MVEFNENCLMRTPLVSTVWDDVEICLRRLKVTCLISFSFCCLWAKTEMFQRITTVLHVELLKNAVRSADMKREDWCEPRTGSTGTLITNSLRKFRSGLGWQYLVKFRLRNREKDSATSYVWSWFSLSPWLQASLKTLTAKTKSIFNRDA